MSFLPQANPEQRDKVSKDLLDSHGLGVQTLWYRAPEVLFGDEKFGVVVGSWSVGLTLAEMAGALFHRQTKTKTATEVDYMTALFGQLGTPTAANLTRLPLWPRAPPQFIAKPLRPEVLAALGVTGASLVEVLLKWDPSERALLSTVEGHAFFNPCSFSLGGVAQTGGEANPTNMFLSTVYVFPLPHKNSRGGIEARGRALVFLGEVMHGNFGTSVGQSSWAGGRHDWNILSGNIEPDILQWLRADPFLKAMQAGLKKAGIDPKAPGTVSKNT